MSIEPADIPEDLPPVTDCPYCTPGEVQTACTNLEKENEFQVWCSGCWAHGPAHATLKAAIEAWNRVADMVR